MSEEPLFVATEIVADAEMVRNLLSDEFHEIVVSTDLDQSIQQFDSCRPRVLILAFNTLEKSERYYLRLYRLSTMIHVLPHRTLVLCNKDDVRRAYELCAKEYFDDYVLFWPIAHDVSRLHMAIHHALRSIADAGTYAPNVAEMAAQAQHIAELEARVIKYAETAGRYVDATDLSVRNAEQAIGAALDGFSRSLSDGAHSDFLEVRDQTKFRSEFDRLKEDKIGRQFAAIAATVEPIREWSQALPEHLEPQLHAACNLQNLVGGIPRVILFIDDDEFQHELLRRALIDEGVDLMCATTCARAFSMLRRRRPDVILMDINLPDLDGVQATQRIKSIEEFASIPVIMVTGQREKDTVVASLGAGAVDFIAKPFKRDSLRAKLRKWLDGGASV